MMTDKQPTNATIHRLFYNTEPQVRYKLKAILEDK